MPDGLLLADKPTGVTSHDVVLALRRRLPRGVKVGHSGTLDPLASGLLILLVGRATKSAARYQRLAKIYRGRIRFGIETATGDLDGEVTLRAPLPELSPESVQAGMDSHLGALELPPPAYSAVKYKGRPLYAWARRGVEVPLAPRPCHVYDWKLLDVSAGEACFRLHCSHGTYARSLAVSLGRRLKTAAALSELRRERIGGYDVADAVPLEWIRTAARPELEGRLLPAEAGEGLPG